MTIPFTVLVDLDSTCYDLLTPTLAWVNATKGLNLTPQDIKEWQWGKALGVNLYDFWAQEGVFYNLKPFRHCKSALQRVNDWGVRQIFFSTLVDGPHVAWDKLRAIERDFPFIGKHNVLLTGHYKDIGRGDLLVDDGPHNIEAFDQFDYQSTVLAYLQPTGYNAGHEATSYKCPNYIMTDWRQYPEIVAKEMQKRG
jgi:5'(3')-deoxyribonucleotidase